LCERYVIIVFNISNTDRGMTMRPTRLQRTGATAVAGGLLLVSGLHPLTYGGEASAPIWVAGYKMIGTLVELTLMNPGQDLVTGKVVVEVTVDGKRIIAHLPFTVWGGQKVFVKFAAPAPVEQIGRVGIIVDDGAPI
jgi:hypothetical protein